MSELRPCPFCGGKAYLSGSLHSRSRQRHWRILCGTKSCQVWGKGYRTRAEAIAAWNRRAEPGQGWVSVEAGAETHCDWYVVYWSDPTTEAGTDFTVLSPGRVVDEEIYEMFEGEALLMFKLPYPPVQGRSEEEG